MHLNQEHPSKCPELFTKLSKDPKQTTLSSSETFAVKRKYAEEEIDDVFLEWIVYDDQPFAVSESPYFKKLMRRVGSWAVPQRTSIKEKLVTLYQCKKSELKTAFEKVASKFSVTCDIWSSPNRMSFFGIKVHYVNNWIVEEKLISFKRLKEKHTGAYLSKLLIDALKEFGIEQRIMGVTCDNASNNCSMIHELELYYLQETPTVWFSTERNQIECAAHVINLAAQAILKHFKFPIDSEYYDEENNQDAVCSALSRLVFFVRKIRRTESLRAHLADFCHKHKVLFMLIR